MQDDPQGAGLGHDVEGGVVAHANVVRGMELGHGDAAAQLDVVGGGSAEVPEGHSDAVAGGGGHLPGAGPATGEADRVLLPLDPQGHRLAAGHIQEGKAATEVCIKGEQNE